jgi:hypothetical protein
VVAVSLGLALCGLYLLRYPITKFALEKKPSQELVPGE